MTPRIGRGVFWLLSLDPYRFLNSRITSHRILVYKGLGSWRATYHHRRKISWLPLTSYPSRETGELPGLRQSILPLLDPSSSIRNVAAWLRSRHCHAFPDILSSSALARTVTCTPTRLVSESTCLNLEILSGVFFPEQEHCRLPEVASPVASSLYKASPLLRRPGVSLGVSALTASFAEHWGEQRIFVLHPNAINSSSFPPISSIL